MTRAATWTTMLIGTAIYQMAKPVFGYSVDFNTLFDAGYWGAAVMLLHWCTNR